MASDTPPVHRVAITGGPCAGKTTALAEVSERLRTRGFRVYVVPEAATIMQVGGASFANLTLEQILIFQTSLLRTQLALEDAFMEVAKGSGRECFLLCDRGACDGKAYMPKHLWERMLNSNGWDMVSLRDGRYDLIVHMVTAADGAEKYYSLENNKARTEPPELAISLDKRTQEAWVGHPHLRIVDNRTDFREKINRTDSRITELAGIHLSKRVVRKFLLQAPVDVSGAEDFNVEQTFLSTGLESDVQESVRRRGTCGVFTYVHKVRRGGQETKRQISNREYISSLARIDPARRTVRIRRQSFLYAGAYFVLDCVTNVHPAVTLLRSHCEEGDDELELPSWIKVDREVTGEQEFSMYSIAERIVPDRVRTKEPAFREEPHRISDSMFARSL